MAEDMQAIVKMGNKIGMASGEGERAARSELLEECQGDSEKKDADQRSARSGNKISSAEAG